VKLRLLAQASLLTALAGLAALALLGAHTWSVVHAGLEGVEEVSRVRDQARALGASLDYLLLVRSDREVLVQSSAEADRLARDVARLGYPSARSAARHVREIGERMRLLAERATARAAPTDDEALHRALLTLRPELRAHEAAVQLAFDELLEERNRRVVDALLQALAVFIAAVIAFAVLAALSSARVSHRLGRPLAAIERGIRELTAGNLDARIALDQDDELGALARSFNELAARRRESEMLKSAIVACSPMPAVSLDGDGRVLSWNPAAERIFGWTADEVIGSAMPIVGPGAVEEFAALRRRVLDGETLVGHDIVRRDKAGDTLALRLYAAPLRDSEGRAFGIMALFEDVSAQRERERSLRLQAGALEAVANGIVVTDHDGRIVWVNPAFTASTGYGLEQALGKRPGDLLKSGEHDPGFYERMWRSILAGEVWRGEVVNRCRDGRTVIEEMSITPLRAGGEGITHFVAIKQDITERRRTERQLAEQTARIAESEERFRYLAQATVDTVRDWDIDADALWWNAGIETMFGYPREAIEPDSRSWTDRLHPDDRDGVLAAVRAALEGGDSAWEGRYRFRRRDGSYARVVDRAFIIRDPGGRATRMVCGMTDITARLELEEQLHRAQRLDALGQLTGGVAHDFNNLLTVIQGNAELLTEELDGDPRRLPLAQMIATAAERGGDLTRRLLAFARRQTLEPRPIDVNAHIEGMRPLLQRTLGEPVEIGLALGPDLPPALVDPAQLESAVLNLCLNARDAMPEGGRLLVDTAAVELDDDYAGRHGDVSPGFYVRVAVSDTGQGIDPGDLEHVFEPFFTTKQSKGNGLGLAMVYGFLKQSGGHVNVYSEPGQGTTVRMYLPQAEAGEAAAAEPPAEATCGGSETVLLVEDDELVRRYAGDQLRALGYRVLEAENGPEALAVLETVEPVHLLFTDVVMPGGMNGRELADAACRVRPDLHVRGPDHVGRGVSARRADRRP